MGDSVFCYYYKLFQVIFVFTSSVQCLGLFVVTVNTTGDHCNSIWAHFSHHSDFLSSLSLIVWSYQYVYLILSWSSIFIQVLIVVLKDTSQRSHSTRLAIYTAHTQWSFYCVDKEMVIWLEALLYHIIKTRECDFVRLSHAWSVVDIYKIENYRFYSPLLPNCKLIWQNYMKSLKNL